MRYSDFKIVETKLREQDVPVYIIGDSHANAMGGGSNNLAVDGANLRAIAAQAQRVPNGAAVYMTGGHNDVAAGTNPNIIAREVKSIIDGLVAKDCDVTYILFPEGTDNTNQEQMGPTRDAIRAAGVPIGEDLDGCSLTDGIHCSVPTYTRILRDGAQDEEGGIENGLQAGPPYPAEDTEEVRALQRKLEELGYSVGSTGIDGKYGPRTSRAVAAYMRDRNITDTDRGRSIPQGELTALASAEPVENPSPTGNERGGSSFNIDPESLAALDFGGPENEQAREIASEYLGREINDRDWDQLIRATWAESTNNPQELAAVMGVILNRVRTNYNNYGPSIRAQLEYPAQFQAVTGTKTGPRDPQTGERTWTGPSDRYRNPNAGNGVQRTAQAVIDHLADANRDWMNFTANDLAAYGDGTDPSFRGRVARSSGSQVIGGTVFGTV
jgi:peptidoglycan hydrolase-like protein with peptidoglycan-binding domain